MQAVRQIPVLRCNVPGKGLITYIFYHNQPLFISQKEAFYYGSEKKQ